MSLVWEMASAKRELQKLCGDIKTDVLVIGGGLTGVLTAYMLKQSGVSCVLAEAEAIGGGVTKNTTAKITVQHGLIYDKIMRKYGLEKAGQYLEINRAALDKYRDLCKSIDCDFEEKDSYVYSIDNRGKIEKEIMALEGLGADAEFFGDLPLPFKVAGAVCCPNQAQFNPLKFIYAISKDLNIYEHTKVRELVGTTAITESGRITAEKVIVATHFPFINKHGGYFIKLYQHRSYVIAFENAQDVNGMYADESKPGMSFRNYGNLLLVGGGAHRTGNKGGNWAELREFAGRYYPDAEEKYHWATQDCMTLDSIAYIGEYSANTDGLYVATGFNKWGMTTAMAAAMVLCDAVQGKENDYQELFSPSRSILHSQLALNIFETAKGMLTPLPRRCPHLGCALKWNSCEHTWDCSCHGSRFAEDGKVLDNPATGDLK